MMFLLFGKERSIGIAATRSREAHGSGGRDKSTSLLTLICDLTVQARAGAGPT